MELTEKEKNVIFQLEGYGKNAILNEISMVCRYTTDREKQNTALILMRKLRGLTETECMELVCDVQKNYCLPYSVRTVGEMIAVARQNSGEEKLAGHDIMALERFDPEVHHMVVFDVLSKESSIGFLGERMRLFLTDVGYGKILGEQDNQFIKIRKHAKVSAGKLYYDCQGPDLHRYHG